MKAKVILAAALSVFLLSCAGTQGTVKKEQPAESAIRVATDPEWPPMEMEDYRGDMIGFDIDVMNAIASAGGFRVAYVKTRWEGLFDGLDKGKWDAVISGVFITVKRTESMGFSIPYVNAGQVLVVQKDQTEVRALSDLRGGTVGAQYGTQGMAVVESMEKDLALQAKGYDEVIIGMRELVLGKIAGFVCEYPVAIQFALHRKDFEEKLRVAGEPFTEEPCGVAVKRGNGDLLDRINGSLTKIIESGELESIRNKWFPKM